MKNQLLSLVQVYASNQHYWRWTIKWDDGTETRYATDARGQGLQRFNDLEGCWNSEMGTTQFSLSTGSYSDAVRRVCERWECQPWRVFLAEHPKAERV